MRRPLILAAALLALGGLGWTIGTAVAPAAAQSAFFFS